MIIAKKIRLLPTKEQEILFRKSAGVARWAYNYFLGEQERLMKAPMGVVLVSMENANHSPYSWTNPLARMNSLVLFKIRSNLTRLRLGMSFSRVLRLKMSFSTMQLFDFFFIAFFLKIKSFYCARPNFYSTK